MPTSVLLAVLAAAGLLALAPALVRRYDATERLAAERAQSTARVLDRQRRRRTVPGPRPIHPPRSSVVARDEPVGETSRSSAVSALQRATIEVSTLSAIGRAAPLAPQTPVRPATAIGRAVWVPIGGAAGRHPATPAQSHHERPARGRDRRAGRTRINHTVAPRERSRQSPAVYRRRRVLASLLVFNAVELVGVFTVGPGFWTGFAVTSLMLAGYVVHLRNEALAAARRRHVVARRAAMIAAVQAEIRAEQARRAAARREALRRAAAARAAAQRDAVRLTQRYVDMDPSRGARLRGRSYETGGWDVRAVGQ